LLTEETKIKIIINERETEKILRTTKAKIKEQKNREISPDFSLIWEKETI
jgi:hypothetical protein